MRAFVARHARALFVVSILGLAVWSAISAGFEFGPGRERLARCGPWLALALVPFLAICALESILWSVTMRLPLRASTVAQLAPMRVLVDTIALTVPGSALASDAAAPLFARDRTGVPIERAIAATAAKKWGVLVGHLALLGIALAVGGGLFRALEARRVVGFAPELAIGVVLIVASAGAFLFVASFRGRLGERILRRLSTSRSAWFRSRLERSARAVSGVDDEVSAFFTERPRRRALVALLSLVVWLVEAIEVYVLLLVLGADPSLVRVVAMEAIVSVVRALAFFSPGGAGVQEVSYLSLVSSVVDAPSPGLGSALVVLRRARDLLVVAVGLVLLARASRESRNPLRTADADAANDLGAISIP